MWYCSLGHKEGSQMTGERAGVIVPKAQHCYFGREDKVSEHPTAPASSAQLYPRAWLWGVGICLLTSLYPGMSNLCQARGATRGWTEQE